jgi:hypothetical protein
VRSPEGRSIPTDPLWRQELQSLLEAGGLRSTGGGLAGSERVVAAVSDKQALLATTGACAVDMESHAVATIASDAGIPFLVVRAIADPADRVIPQAALEALRPDGQVRVAAVLGGVIRQPSQLIALLRLARESAVALTNLRRAAALGGPRLGYDQGARLSSVAALAPPR